MTKRLEDFFNIEAAGQSQEQPQEIDHGESAGEDQLPLQQAQPEANLPITIETIQAQLTVANKIEQALPQVRGLETEDRDLDNYAQEAMDSYQKLMDLGFNVDDRTAGKIFEVASTMMNNAITAKTTKLDKKLKMVELQLRLARLQKDLGKEEDAKPENNLTVDRNAILNLISQNLKNKDK
jgi:hypothetical protein